MSFVKHVTNTLKWTTLKRTSRSCSSQVKAAPHDLQAGIKRLDPKPLVAGIVDIEDLFRRGPQWRTPVAPWATSFYEQHSGPCLYHCRSLAVGRRSSSPSLCCLHYAASAVHSSSSHSSGKHSRDLTPAVNMIEEFLNKGCASCGKSFNPKVAQKCDACVDRCDKEAPKLSSTDTEITMTPAAQETSSSAVSSRL